MQVFYLKIVKKVLRQCHYGLARQLCLGVLFSDLYYRLHYDLRDTEILFFRKNIQFIRYKDA